MKRRSTAITKIAGLALLCIVASMTASAADVPVQKERGVSRSVLGGVDKFFDGLRGNYIDIGQADALVSAQFTEAVSVPADEVLSLKGGLQLLSGCRYHMCSTEKGAVLIDRDGRIVAAALLRVPTTTTADEKGLVRRSYDFDSPVLTIFARKAPVSDDAKSILVAWVSEKLKAEPLVTAKQQAEQGRHFRVEQKVM